MGVTLKTRHVVVPAKPTWQGILPLSEFDQVGVISHTSVLYFYDRPSHDDWIDPSKNKLINTLKDSLSRVLVHFYPLAGRLSWLPGSRLQLDCNAVGAELIEADSPDELSKFGDFVESSKSMFRDLLSHIDYVNQSIEDLPLLSVQVTRFACRGVCVSIHFSHVLMDGRSLFHFIKEWARLARGEPLELEPYLDRLALVNHKTSIGEDPKEVDDADPCLPFAEMGDEPEEETTESSLPTLIVITPNQIEHLKKLANQEFTAEVNCRPYSRFEAITSHVWKCMTIARDLEADQITSFYVIVDGRSRLEPPLPPSYFGNAIVPAKASSNAKDLISKPLSYGCGKIREAIKQLSNKYMKGTLEHLQKQESLENYQIMEDRGDMVGNAAKGSPDLWVSSAISLFAHEINFGWGNEIYAGPPTGLCDDRNFLITPHYPNISSLKLVLGSQHKDKFLKLFNQYWE